MRFRVYLCVASLIIFIHQVLIEHDFVPHEFANRGARAERQEQGVPFHPSGPGLEQEQERERVQRKGTPHCSSDARRNAKAPERIQFSEEGLVSFSST